MRKEWAASDIQDVPWSFVVRAEVKQRYLLASRRLHVPRQALTLYSMCWHQRTVLSYSRTSTKCFLAGEILRTSNLRCFIRHVNHSQVKPSPTMNLNSHIRREVELKCHLIPLCTESVSANVFGQTVLYNLVCWLQADAVLLWTGSCYKSTKAYLNKLWEHIQIYISLYI